MTRTSRKRSRVWLALPALTALIVALAVAVAPARMSSTDIGPLLCETTGGGKFVDIPGFPGEKIDRRLLRDIRWLEQRYAIFITDGYSMSDVHSREGEHPLGLALDIVPNKAAGGSWREITRLARWAEPKQNQPRAPFRWVGYNGDAGHGRGDHLHLSWAHSQTRPGTPAKLVNTLRCPTGSAAGGAEPVAPEEPTEPPTGGGPAGDPPNDGGGRGGRGGRGGTGHGGVAPKLQLAPPVVETDGVGR